MSSKKAWMESVGVAKAAVRYHTNRQYIYRWMKRYDGTLHSLEDRSHLHPLARIGHLFIGLWRTFLWIGQLYSH